MLVAIVICLNVILIGFEADLGMLGMSSPAWAGLDLDMDFIGMNPKSEAALRGRLKEGLVADSHLKHKVRDEIRDLTLTDVDIQERLDLKKGSAHLKSGAYTAFEFCFALFFTVEFLIRLCDSGRGFCKQPWNLFDGLLVVAGLSDVILPFFLVSTDPAEPASDSSLICLSLLRNMRILRVIRLFRVCDGLRTVGSGFAIAVRQVMWIGATALLVNFMIASLLTSTIGQKSYMWEEQASQVHMWFGSCGRSLQTLFSIMTLSGWDEIATVLSAVLPSSAVGLSIALYIMLCFFAMLSLGAGLVTHALGSVQRDEDQRKGYALEHYRFTLAERLMSILAACDTGNDGFLTRQDYKSALEAHPAVLGHLRALEIETTIDELLVHFDRLSQDSGSSRKAVRIELLVEALVHLKCGASSSEVFDVKYSVAAMRRETAEQLTVIKKEVDGQKELIDKTLGRLGDTRKDVATTLQSLTTMQQQVAQVCKTVEILAAKVDQSAQETQAAKAEQSCAMTVFRTNVEQKLELICGQANDSRNQLSTLYQKLDALGKQVSTQVPFEEKIEYLSTQFAAQFAAQFTAQYSAASHRNGDSDISSQHTGVPDSMQLAADGDHAQKSKLEDPESTQHTEESGAERAAASDGPPVKPPAFVPKDQGEPESQTMPELSSLLEPESTASGVFRQVQQGAACAAEGEDAWAFVAAEPETTPAPKSIEFGDLVGM